MSTKIEWCTDTWNPVTGCTKVSTGCKHCFAEGVADRFWATQYPKVQVTKHQGTVDPDSPIEYRPRKFTDVQCHPDRLEQPLRWRKPRRVFVNSMSDLFHEDVPDEFIDRVFAVMGLAPRHTFQVLTKRPARMRAYFADEYRDAMIEGAAQKIYAERHDEDPSMWLAVHMPLPNVWLGVSAESQATADERIPILLQTPAALRFLSLEPLLEAVTVMYGPATVESMLQWRPLVWSEERGEKGTEIDWAIIGGESGPHARPCNTEWIRILIKQFRALEVPVFVKQLGAKPYYDDPVVTDRPNPIDILDRKGGDPEDWPADLHVREFPAVGGAG